MNTQIKIIVLVLALLGIGAFLYFENNSKKTNSEVNIQDNSSSSDFSFKNKGLKTNTAKLSIPLDKVLDGGPGKDGIPALTNPSFVSISDAEKFLNDDTEGIKVSVGGTTRFYPFTILVWHEIINDTIENKRLVVTFCPLCGSSIVFDADNDGKSEIFGVSGKLYESNLLMYDKDTESLWSQIQGEAVVGDRTGEKLMILPSQVISFKGFKSHYPQATVLSNKTGYQRDYSFYPYGDYNTSQKLYFPISINDTRLPAKEIMYVVNYKNRSVAFKRAGLKNGVAAKVKVGDETITARIHDGEISVTTSLGTELPGYNAMWFSWAIYNQKDGVVWEK